MRIYLIGYMGSGKSSMGKKLATRLGYTFLDLDAAIEQEQQQSITALFSEKGEDAFRCLERLALHQTLLTKDVVVSTGGGTPVFFDNINLMNQNGLSIYLKAEPDVLVNRLIPNQHLRPIIANLDHEELLSFIKEQLERRAPFYEKAKMHIEAKDLTPAILHTQVLNWIKTHNEN